MNGAPACNLSQSLPILRGRAPPTPARRVAQHELTQKLMAMDLALERIDRAEAPGSVAGRPSPGEIPSTALEPIAGFHPRQEQPEVSLREVEVRLASQLSELQEAQRTELTKFLADFEAELLTILEIRAREADARLEQRLIEAASQLERRQSHFEAAFKESESSHHGLGGLVEQHLAELTATVASDRARAAEGSQSCTDALQIVKEQLNGLRQRMQHVEEESRGLKEQVSSCRLGLQSLHDDWSEGRDQLGGLHRRIAELQDDRAAGAADTELRVRRSEESLLARLREAESRMLSSAEGERSFKRLGETLAIRLSEAEQGLLRAQGELEGLRRSMEELRIRPAAVDPAAVRRIESSMQDLQRTLDGKLVSAEERLLRGTTEAAACWKADVEAKLTANVELLRESIQACLPRNEQQKFWSRLDGLQERQRQHQELLEELLQASDQGGRVEVVASASSQRALEEVSVGLGGRIQALASRVTMAEEAAASASSSASAAVAMARAVPRDAVSAEELNAVRTRLAALEAQVTQQSADVTALSEGFTSDISRLRAELGVCTAAFDNIRQDVKLWGDCERVAAEAQEAAAKADRAARGAQAATSAAQSAAEVFTSIGGGEGLLQLQAQVLRLEATQEDVVCVCHSSLQEFKLALESLSHRSSSLGSPSAAAEPWRRDISMLEQELKGLLAAQFEDSAIALRTIADAVDELRALGVAEKTQSSTLRPLCSSPEGRSQEPTTELMARTLRPGELEKQVSLDVSLLSPVPAPEFTALEDSEEARRLSWRTAAS